MRRLWDANAVKYDGRQPDRPQLRDISDEMTLKQVEGLANAIALSNIRDDNEVEKNFRTVYRLYLR